MLVLTRKQQEKIRIGDDIVITILRMKGKSVRLGIEAPGSVPVLRGELVFATNGEESADRQKCSERVSDAADGKSRSAGDRKSATLGRWPTAANPRPAPERVSPSDPRTMVHEQRVPRTQRSNVVPQLIHCGPLRSQLDERLAAR